MGLCLKKIEHIDVRERLHYHLVPLSTVFKLLTVVFTVMASH